MLKLTEEVYGELAYAYKGETIHDESLHITVVEANEWEVDHKMEYRRIVVFNEDDGKYYAFDFNRHGDYYRGYELYNDNSDRVGTPVTKTEKVITVYV